MGLFLHPQRCLVKSWSAELKVYRTKQYAAHSKWCGLFRFFLRRLNHLFNLFLQIPLVHVLWNRRRQHLSLMQLTRLHNAALTNDYSYFFAIQKIFKPLQSFHNPVTLTFSDNFDLMQPFIENNLTQQTTTKITNHPSLKKPLLTNQMQKWRTISKKIGTTLRHP